MKALPFKIPHGSKSSLHVDHEKLEHFYPTYHIHEEIQLVLIIRGQGTAYIGDRILEFYDGDIFLLGQNLPHVFKDNNENSDGVESISIFFLSTFMGAGFLELPEARLISILLEKSKTGLRLQRDLKQSTAVKILKLLELKSMKRLQAMLEILEGIAESEDIELISSPGYRKPKRAEDGRKINNVFDYMLANYSEEIGLDEIANVANLSATAFCRYFKQHTRKTFSRYLNELRVGQACKELIENHDTIATIGYNCGFNNISNFNRQFKQITGITPSDYQKQHL